ncbi:hypothetical protein M409DRAFT_53895 [Zasmidium cellare ATCC 36951]|uniref:Carbohydrate kinase PfkB domain-containing protein n=1 Tax=Zasmidium cellare ATCC 36951 TaxID=1080233 RepID=A0A6A6CR46_ZASCE|nr:uncharacterized protein M409DRAFT_53895 [Zasmidium cellare ATCC 36951]KAF2167956.1 hypothetical protein M409DRAFT_53895 [Zasmidium cellare ATCC 36951]
MQSPRMSEKDEVTPLFVSLGMLVLDELHLPDSTTQHNVIGGSGAYSTLGARLAVEDSQSRRIASFVLAGHDFPYDKVEKHFRPWGIDYTIKRLPTTMSTRGRLEYHDWKFEHKSYSYLTTPLQPRPIDLPLRFLQSSTFHLLSSPDVLSTQLSELSQRRLEHGITVQPLLVWEPAPLSCTANFLDAYIDAARLVDVFSPNHVELLGLCERSLKKHESFDKGLIEACATRFFATEHSNPRICIVRCGEHGAVVLERNQSPDFRVKTTWVAPFFSPAEAGRVVDATGGGNTFLGAFAVEYQQNRGDAVLAARKASVAASFALEQIGPPDFGEGTWNGVTVEGRMGEYLKRVENS